MARRAGEKKADLRGEAGHFLIVIVLEFEAGSNTKAAWVQREDVGVQTR